MYKKCKDPSRCHHEPICKVEQTVRKIYMDKIHNNFISVNNESIPISKEDIVNHPKHYMMLPDMEAIEGIKKLLTEEEFIGFLKGNFFKYRFRAGDKDDLAQDIAKSNWYRDYLREIS